jgi:hypothetical protein
VTTTLATRAPHAWLADGELGILALGGLAVRTRERRPDQATMNRAFVLDGNGRGILFFGRRCFRRGFHRLERFWQFC